MIPNQNKSLKPQCAIFVASRTYALANSRIHLINHFKENGWQVVTIANIDKHSHSLVNLGVKIEPLNLRRGGGQFLSDTLTFLQLKRLYKKYNPRLIHHFHAKPVILGNLAAPSNQLTKVVNTITGLGHAFTSNQYIRYAALFGYKAALRKSTMTIFQNSANQKLFLEYELVKPETSCLIVSSGVDIQKYQPQKTKPSLPQNKIKILFASRLLKSKGISEFIQAARILAPKYDNVIFQIAGEWDESHPDTIEPQEIFFAQKEGFLDFLGYIDLGEHFKETDIFVYPSFYAEGVARVLLEAAASGVAVVTTNIPGCREAVDDGSTGILVEPQNTDSLIKAIEYLIRSPVQCERMGQAGRAFTMKHFDIKLITKAYLNTYRQLGIEI